MAGLTDNLEVMGPGDDGPMVLLVDEPAAMFGVGRAPESLGFGRSAVALGAGLADMMPGAERAVVPGAGRSAGEPGAGLADMMPGAERAAEVPGAGRAAVEPGPGRPAQVLATVGGAVVALEDLRSVIGPTACVAATSGARSTVATLDWSAPLDDGAIAGVSCCG